MLSLLDTALEDNPLQDTPSALEILSNLSELAASGTLSTLDVTMGIKRRVESILQVAGSSQDISLNSSKIDATIQTVDLSSAFSVAAAPGVNIELPA